MTKVLTMQVTIVSNALKSCACIGALKSSEFALPIIRLALRHIRKTVLSE